MIRILRNIKAKRSEYLVDLLIVMGCTMVLVAGYLLYVDWCVTDDECMTRVLTHQRAKWSVR